MSQFKGFPPGKDHMTPVPATFFNQLLPLIDDLAELKVLLFCFQALPQRDGEYPYLLWRDFIAHQPLMAGLQAARPEADPLATLRDGLARAVARGALVTAQIEISTGERIPVYFANTERGRNGVDQIKRGEWRPGSAENPVEILPERPTIYKLYESNIGPLTPMIAEELKDAEQEFGADWLEEALRLAVTANKRSLRYMRGILQRWKKDGKDDESGRRTEETEKSYITGKYADFIDH